MDHLLLWGISVASLVLFAAMSDSYRGKALVTDAILFTSVFLASGYYLAGLPQIWRITERSRLEGLVLPVFIVLVLGYFVLALQAGFIQPAASAVTVLMQASCLVVLVARS